MLMSISGISSAAHAKVWRFFLRQVMSSVLKGSRRLVQISTHRSGNASSRHTVTTGSKVGSHFSSRISSFRNCQKSSAESCSWAFLSEANFFLGMVLESDIFRFSYAAKQTCDTLGFPHIVLFPQGVENLRQKWYVDGIACIKFNHGVPMITLYDAGRSTTRNSAILAWFQL